MKKPIVKFVGDWFGAVDCWIDDIEAIPARHLAKDLERYIKREPTREAEFRQYFKGDRLAGPVGDVVAASTPLDQTRMDAVMSQAAQLSAFHVLLAELKETLLILEDFRMRYKGREYLGVSLADVRSTLTAWCATAHKAHLAAEKEFSKCVQSLPNKARNIGTTVGGKTLLSTIDLAVLTGTTPDAARKLISEKKLPIHRIGKRKYVSLEDFLAATREDPDGSPSS